MICNIRTKDVCVCAFFFPRRRPTSFVASLDPSSIPAAVPATGNINVHMPSRFASSRHCFSPGHLFDGSCWIRWKTSRRYYYTPYGPTRVVTRHRALPHNVMSRRIQITLVVNYTRPGRRRGRRFREKETV